MGGKNKIRYLFMKMTYFMLIKIKDPVQISLFSRIPSDSPREPGIYFPGLSLCSVINVQGPASLGRLVPRAMVGSSWPPFD